MSESELSQLEASSNVADRAVILCGPSPANIPLNARLAAATDGAGIMPFWALGHVRYRSSGVLIPSESIASFNTE